MSEQPPTAGGFESTAARLPETTQAAQVTAREQSEIQAAFVIALNHPRDEHAAYLRIIKSCQRPAFAEGARYVYPRGGAKVEGPSVKLARECARCWGNLRYGYRVVDRTPADTTLEGFCHDLETNAMNSAAVSFKNLIYRKDGGGGRWITPEERDYRELLAKNGAIVVRNAILQVLPPDIVEEAMREVRRTIVKAAEGEIKADPEATARHIVVAFSDLRVTKDMLERRLGHPVGDITEDEVADLKGVYAALRDGQTTRDEAFPPAAAPATAKKKSKLDQAAAELGGEEATP